MLTLSLVIALLLAVGAVLGLAPGRASDEPPTVETLVKTVTVTSSYRGTSAARWAARFRHRTRQLQAVKRQVKKVQASLRQAPWGNSPLEQAFLCIHTFEGSWTDSGAPFWGGLQMDSSFQASYGDWALRAFGTADHWPISVQIATAIRAKVSGRGFYPWPNTARSCGLL